MSDYPTLKLLMSLAFILGLILALAWAARRKSWMAHTAPQPIRLIGSRRISPKHTIVLVEVGDTRLLLGMGQNSLSLLHVFPHGPAQNPKAGEPGTAPLPTNLKHALGFR